MKNGVGLWDCLLSLYFYLRFPHNALSSAANQNVPHHQILSHRKLSRLVQDLNILFHVSLYFSVHLHLLSPYSHMAPERHLSLWMIEKCLFAKCCYESQRYLRRPVRTSHAFLAHSAGLWGCFSLWVTTWGWCGDAWIPALPGSVCVFQVLWFLAKDPE